MTTDLKLESLKEPIQTMKRLVAQSRKEIESNATDNKTERLSVIERPPNDALEWLHLDTLSVPEAPTRGGWGFSGTKQPA